MLDAATELGWPVAVVIVALVTLAIVRRLTAAPGSFKLRLKDWVNFEREPELREELPLIAKSAESLAQEGHADGDKEGARTTVETLEEVASENSATSASHFIIEEDPSRLAEAFDRFREEPSYADDPDFWESIYVDRRRELNLGNEEEELKNLSERNPEWVWPLIFLIRRYVRLHNTTAAEATLKRALARRDSRSRKWVLREGVNLYYSIFGSPRAIRFIQDTLADGPSDAEISAILKKLAEFGKEDDVFSQAIPFEIANNLTPENDSTFSIAYLYGSVPEFGIISFQRYKELIQRNSRHWNAANNMGVLVKQDRDLEVHYFEEALACGSPVSYANLARMLASDGYVARAQMLLDSAPDAGSDIEGLAAITEAQPQVAAAKSVLEKKRERYEAFASEQDRRYKALLFGSFEYFRERGDLGALGAFVSVDRSLGLWIGPEFAHCAYRVSDRVLGGRLARKPLCFEGRVSGSGGGGLLDHQFRRILAVQVSDDEIRALIWPSGFNLESPLQVIELRRVSHPSALPEGGVFPEVTQEHAAKLITVEGASEGDRSPPDGR